MSIPVIMPKQGQSVESCVIVGWKKQPGDKVKIGDIICEVETDKATFEVESPAEGTLLAIFHDAGSDVPVLAPIAAIGKPGEPFDSLRGTGAVVVRESAAARTGPTASSPAGGAAASAFQAAPLTPSGRIMASPRAKALAAARGVPLGGVKGSGPGGRIIERDVAAAGSGSPAAPARQPAMAAARVGGDFTSGEIREVKITGIRKLISDRMIASLQSTAQLTLNTAADARALLALRARFKTSPESMGLRGITINDMVIFAAAGAVARHPELNALYVGDTLKQHASVHLGFAVDTPRGLMVPVIRGAQSRSLRDISREAGRLIAGCRDGGITPDELAGGTFTLTNLGAFGVQSFTPVLNAPQVAILGVCAIAPGPVLAADGSVSFVPQIGLSLTINHQVVDGAPGARFLQSLSADIAAFDLLLAR
jgi:pyruvate dehydrogenase E2 component (dihydrolipoamide acetyltransferase)